MLQPPLYDACLACEADHMDAVRLDQSEMNFETPLSAEIPNRKLRTAKTSMSISLPAFTNGVSIKKGTKICIRN